MKPFILLFISLRGSLRRSGHSRYRCISARAESMRYTKYAMGSISKVLGIGNFSGANRMPVSTRRTDKISSYWVMIVIVTQ